MFGETSGASLGDGTQRENARLALRPRGTAEGREQRAESREQRAESRERERERERERGRERESSEREMRGETLVFVSKTFLESLIP